MTWLDRTQISPTAVPSQGTSTSSASSTRRSTPRIGSPVVARWARVPVAPGLASDRVSVGDDSVIP